MKGTPAMIAPNGRRAALRTGTAMAAALALWGTTTPARADGFNGTVTSSTNATFNSATDISVSAAEAVINWNATATSASATNIDFLPSGQTVTFNDGISSGLSDFTVLNRVTPTFGGAPIAATISFSGTVNSTIAGQQGGNVWFYSPYGIIANAGSQFNVGSLLLTTSDIQLNGAGGLYLDQNNGNQIGFQQATQTGSFVRIQPGAVISASNLSVNNAYVGIFAPRIEQGGNIRSDGMTALVAAEAGTITFNAGLVNVAVSVGTGDANGIVHTGSTGGAASAAGETKTVAMVAVPKNTALTMLLGGSIGYDAAAVGVTDGAAVELFAGSSTQNGQASPDGAHLNVITPNTDTTGNMRLRNLTVGSKLDALATGTLSVDPLYAGVNSPGYVDFVQTANLYAGSAINITADAAETITAQDSLFLKPMFLHSGENVNVSVTGDPTGTLAGGQIGVANLFSIDASGLPDVASSQPALLGSNGTGGTVGVSVSRGIITVGQGYEILANGIGSDGDQQGGTGTGGSVDVGVSSGGTISAPGLFLSAVGRGGNSFGNLNATGGNAVGGAITLHDDGGTLPTGDIFLQSWAQGGDGIVATGSATGGRATVRLLGSSQNWSSLTALTYAVSGSGPASASIGSATALANGLLVDIGGTGSLNVGSVSLDNGAFTAADGTVAHVAKAGDVTVNVGTGGNLTVTGFLIAQANADLPIDTLASNVAVAPVMTGGKVSILANGGTINANGIIAEASAFAVGTNAGGTGSTAQGGSASIGATAGGSLSATTALEARAEAFGAVGPVAGHAIGGTARVYADGGTITAPAGIVVSASALSGGYDLGQSITGTGFNTTGGTATLEVLGATGRITTADVRVYAKGEASVLQDIPLDGAGDIPGFTPATMVGIDGNGGTGTGGTAQIRVTGGNLDAGQLLVRAYGIGGTSGSSGGATRWQSGAGLGGQALFTQTGGTINAATLNLRAAGLGGGLAGAADIGALAANGGAGSGGTARASLSGGTLSLTGALVLDAQATGGIGMDSADAGAGGNGGAANNGAALAELLMPAGSTASLAATGVSATAAAFGGSGGASAAGTAGSGGAALAGTARASLADGGFTLPSGMFLSATAFGSGTASGTGGTAAFVLSDTVATPATTRTIGPLQLDATGNGASSTAGTTVFTAQAGRAASALTLGTFTALANGATAPAGNGFTGNFGAVPVTVQGNVFVQTSRDIALATTAGGGINAAGAIILQGRSINGTGTGTLATNTSFTATTTNGGITLGGVSATGAATLNATGGAVTVGNLNAGGTATATGTAVTIGSSGSLTFGTATAGTGSYAVTAAGNLTFANVSAPGALTLQAGGFVAVNGVAQGSSVAISSGDIRIGTSGRIGTRGLTQTIVLTNTAPAAGTALGGAAANSGWSLDAAEALRLFADQSITVAVPANATAPADVVVGALGFTYGPGVSAVGVPANIGTGGLFAVTTPGRIRVIGAVAPTLSSATDRFSLTAGTFIDVVTNTGSIVLRDANGALAGILSLTAPTVRVATTSALSALDGITSLTAASQRLDQNDGVVNLLGAIQANGLVFTVSGSTLYIQNSGTGTSFDARRGFTANSLAINGLNGAQPSFAINGVINAATGALTGLTTYTGVTINGTAANPGGAFNPFSTINGCLVGPACGIKPGLIAPPREVINPLAGLPGAGTGAGNSALNLPIVQYGETPLLDSPPLIDEPVTGIGNDDLWQQRCDAEKDCVG